MKEFIESCNLCPRRCGTNRIINDGFCGAGAHIRVARAALHMWEEPCISGTRGSGTVFFTGCALKCCFCQNYQVSSLGLGKDISVQDVVDIFARLESEGAHNINLVTASAYVPQIINALDIRKINIPIVYNTSGYESAETLKLLQPYVDVYLTDLKYYSAVISKKYSKAANYFEIASAAILQMAQCTPECKINSEGIMEKGLIVRHLVLPGNLPDTRAVLLWLSQNLPTDSYKLSLMSQYTPFYNAFQFKELSRRLSSYEYKKAMEYAQELGLVNGYFQEKSSASEEYTPPFDLQGV